MSRPYTTKWAKNGSATNKAEACPDKCVVGEGHWGDDRESKGGAGGGVAAIGIGRKIQYM
jgi:hypothetical protein